MAKLVDYIFRNSYYKEVQEDHREATEKLTQAYELWLGTVPFPLGEDYKSKEFVHDNIKGIRAIQTWITDANYLLRNKKKAVLWLYHDTYGYTEIPTLNLNEYRFIAKHKTKVVEYADVLTKYNLLTKNYKDAVNRFLNIPPTKRTYDEIKRVVSSERKIKQIADVLNKAKKCMRESPKAWDLFAQDRTIDKIPLPELDSINPDYLSSKEWFLHKWRTNRKLISLILGNDRHNINSFDKETIEEEEDLMVILAGSEINIPDMPEYTIHLQDSKKLKCAILDSVNYGVKCNFSESFSISDFYELRKKLDNVNVSFDEAVSKLKKNEKAVKAYNQEKYGKSVVYIPDYFNCIDESSELYSYISLYKKKEQIEQEFVDKVATDYRRSNFYKGFIKNKWLSKYQEKEYCVTHLDELDKYILDLTQREYASLKTTYPDGVEYCEKYEHPYGLSNYETVYLSKDKIPHWDIVYKKYKRFQTHYPIGLPAFEQFNSYDDGENSAGLTIEEIIECENDIAKFQKEGERIKTTSHFNGDSLINRTCKIYGLQYKLKEWGNVRSIPYYFFYHYYPTRFTDISEESEKARKFIWNFKDGNITRPNAASLVSEKLKETFSSYELESLTLVCIPASSISVNRTRYESFSKRLCFETGMRNAFGKISIIKEKVPAHLSENNETEPAEYSFDRDFFKGSNVILFDDVVTRGRSMDEFKRYITEMGGEVIGAISLGRTYSDYHGNARTPHPYSGKL